MRRVLPLLLRAHHQFHIPSRSHPQHLHALLRSFSSIPPRRFTPNSPFPPNPSLLRRFSSDSVIADVFSKPRDSDEVKKLLDSNGVSINHDAVVAVLEKLKCKDNVAVRFFHWVSETHPECLSSKSRKAMCQALRIGERYGLSGGELERILAEHKLKEEERKMRDVIYDRPVSDDEMKQERERQSLSGSYALDLEHASAIAELFSKPGDWEEVKKQLDTNHASINHVVYGAVLGELRMKSNFDAARRFIKWVRENRPEDVSRYKFSFALKLRAAMYLALDGNNTRSC